MKNWRHGMIPLPGLVLALLFAPPALGRPRDDVMSGAYRCAAIGEDRQWLDCYYGAAQPARAALGLKPAPSSQTALVTAPPGGPVMPQSTATRDAVMAAAARCGSFAQDRPWLDCYYAAAQPMRAALGLAPAPQAATVPVSQERGAPPAPFGLAAPPRPDLASDHVESRMAAYSFNKLGVFTVTLANGQVWRQVDGDTDHAHWTGPAARYVVRITHGFLGSFNFRIAGQPGLYKVLRVQ